MARVIPPQLPPDAPRSERVVHQALTALPEPWVGIADIPIGLFGRPRPGMAQLDFLLVHPRNGLCVLEVKGGTVEVREGTWYTTPRGGPDAGRPQPLRRSPFTQAADQRFELQRFLWKHLSIPSEAMAHAVALPDCTVEGALGPDAPRGIVLDMHDLQTVEAAASRAMKTWKTSLSLSDADLERLIRLLKPSIELTVVLASEVALTEQGLQRETRRQVAFTDSQVAVYESMLRHQRMVVIGEAGTGKTVLAVERAKRLTETGLRTLVLCHRGAVAAFMRTLIGGGTRRRLALDSLEGLTVTPFGEFLAVLGEESGRKVPNAPPPDWVLGAAEDVGVQFDALVVDEAQEFTQGQLEALLFLLSDPDESPVYLFADPFQHSARFSTGHMLDRREMRGRYNWRPPENFDLVTLVDNVRNSAPIARALSHFLVQQQSVARVDGPEPEVITTERVQVVAQAMSRVKRLITDDGFKSNQVLVVTVGFDKDELNRAAQRASLDVVDVVGVARWPLPPADLRVAVGGPDDVQGLEAEVVVVLVRGGELTVGDVRDIYVAASRARSHLIVVGRQPFAKLQTAAKAALAAATDAA